MNRKRVLFVCVHNSARSQMAEAFLRQIVMISRFRSWLFLYLYVSKNWGVVYRRTEKYRASLWVRFYEA